MPDTEGRSKEAWRANGNHVPPDHHEAATQGEAECDGLTRRPNDPEPERCVLRTILRYPECVPEVREALGSTEFYWDCHQRIYVAALGLADQGAPIEAYTVSRELERRHWSVELGGTRNAIVFLAELLDGVANPRNVMYYVGLVKDAAKVRHRVANAPKLYALLLDEKAPADVVAHELRQAAEALGGDGQEAQTSGWASRWITTAELMRETERPTWLIKRVMVKGQPVIIGAPQKAGKTSVAIDMAVSLDTATPFLDYFEVYRRVKVAMISGESGGFTIMNHARQVCAARGIDPDAANVLWQFDLPQLANPAHLARLANGIRREKIEVVIVDPLYLCLLSGAPNVQASNVFDMGPLLLEVAKACLGAGATPVLLHHTNRPANAKRGPLELGDLSFSGTAEFARQWLLLNRREPFTPASRASFG